ncbi:MAG: element excision factor XisI family protein [Oscillatoria sp. PMC 1068.18]|nr:element excision factor XisI family protein [Oscillatoria sp. PMC 1076.18]MEC4991774.1 element excision factor XisI family protein [Oscillatoria sp. PMC 1068.18]
MDTTAHNAEIVKQIIQYYAKLLPSHGEIRLDTVFDDQQNRYALMQTGWDRGRRIRGNLIYVTLEADRIYIEYDGMESGIIQDLIAKGIEREQIVLSYLPETEVAITT